MSDKIQAMSNIEYHADREYLSSSALKMILKDPQEFYKTYIVGGVVQVEKAVFTEGSFVHSLILEPEKVATQYAIFPGMRKAGEAWETFKAENADKTVLSAPQALRCEALVKSYAALPPALALTSGGFPEHALVGEVSGIKVKMRADYINVSKGYIMDVKTSSQPSGLEIFKETVRQYSYDLSAALYCSIAQQTFQAPFDFYFIVLSKADQGCNIYKCSTETMNIGLIKVLQAVNLYKTCVASNTWELKDKKVSFDTKDYEIEEV